MPRRSAASLALDSFLPGSGRLQPPPHLTALERAVWIEITSTTPPQHFKPEDSHLLEAYCSAVVQRRQAAAEIATDSKRCVRSPWCEQHISAVRALRTLSVALRLGPIARHPDNRRRDATVLDRPASAYDFLGDGDDLDSSVWSFDDLRQLQDQESQKRQTAAAVEEDKRHEED